MQSIFSIRLLRLMAIVVPALVLIGCFGEGDGKQQVPGTPQQTSTGDDDYILVFADEFNAAGVTAPSAANWTIETGYGPNNDGWGNNEWQQYTNSPDNVRVEGGNLVLTALCPSPPCGVRDGTVTSGKINSLNKFNFKFGRVEARIKPPVGDGAWPAFWALGANHPQIGWPRSGEIDFMEMHNAFSDDRTTHFTVHWCDQTLQAPDECSFPEGWIFYTQNRSFSNSLGDDFHIFEAEWNAERIIGKIDGIEYFNRTIDAGTMEEFLREFYMILNVAMGGTLGSNNQPPNGTEVFPQTMLVDYVRVYQLPEDIDTGGDDFKIDFEDDGGPYMFNDFEGGVGFVTENPDMDGNASAKVAKLLKFAGGAGELFAGTTLKTDSFDVPADSSFTMKAWYDGDGPRNILFKLEGASPAEVTVTHPGGGWQELTMDFPGVSGSFSGITFILELDTPGADPSNPDDPNWTVYIDDIMLVPGDDGGDPDPDSATIDFEDDGGPYIFNDFEGGVGFVTDNPDMNGNTSAKVAKLLKFAGGAGELFAGTTLKTESIDVPADSSFTMKAWYDGDGPRNILFKLEGASPAEVTVTHPGGGWQELTMDFPGVSGTFSGITFILELDTPGADPDNPDDPNWTVYIDDIMLIPGDNGGDPDPDSATIDFEPAGGPYMFNEFEGGVAFVAENPDMNGNTSANVAKMLKYAGGATFAGTTLKLASPLDTANGTTFSAKVWGNRPDLSGTALTFKLEGAAPGLPQEVVVTHGNTGWEELTFELPAASGMITGITFIFDNGVPGATPTDPPSEDPNWTFYVDDITQIPPDDGGDPGASVLADFEDGGGPYVFNDFEGGAGAVVDNPDQSGINTSAKVGRMQKFAGAVFAGTTLKPAAPIEVVAGTSFTMKVWSQRVVPVLFKLEGTPDVELEVTHGGSGWELLTFDFPGVSGMFTGITLIFDNGVAGAAGTDEVNWTFYFDDITQIPPGSGNGDPGSGTVSSLVTDFETDGGPYVFDDFAGGAASVIDNPDQTGIDTSERVGQMLKYAGETYGGSTLMLSLPLDVPAGSSFKMKVWSSREVPVLFKLEGAGPAEVSATHGGGSVWEELTFEFPSFEGTIDGVTLIFDLGTNGAAATDPANWTFYFDDITLVSPCNDCGSASQLADFETDGEPYTFDDFAGGAASVIDNPDQTGINTSDRIGQMLKYAGETYGGSTLILPSAVDVPAGSSFTMKVWSSREVPVLFKLEGAAPAEVSATHGGGSVWEELTFAFPAFAGSVTGITQIYDLGVNGAAATAPANWTFYFDDITLTTVGR